MRSRSNSKAEIFPPGSRGESDLANVSDENIADGWTERIGAHRGASGRVGVATQAGQSNRSVLDDNAVDGIDLFSKVGSGIFGQFRVSGGGLSYRFQEFRFAPIAAILHAVRLFSLGNDEGEIDLLPRVHRRPGSAQGQTA
jgi:hypothetical protein